MDIPLEDIKNKLLKRGFQQDREGQLQIAQLQPDLEAQSDEPHLQQIITLEGDQEFTIQHVPVENHVVSLTKKVSMKMKSTGQESNIPLQEFSAPLNQNQFISDIESDKKHSSNYEELIESYQKYNQQLLGSDQNDIGQQLDTHSRLTQEEQKEDQLSNLEPHQNREVDNQGSNLVSYMLANIVETNPNLRKLKLINKFQSEMLEHLTKLTQQEFDTPLNELNGQFCLNLYMKLRHYQKLIIIQFLFQGAFILATAYYSFRQFDITMLGAKLILLYLLKNIIELYATKKQMNVIYEKLEDYDFLKEKLLEQQRLFQSHITNIRNNQQVLQDHIQQQQNQVNTEQLAEAFLEQLLNLYGRNTHISQMEENTNQIINQNISSMGQLMAFLQKIKDDDEFKRKQAEIQLLKERVQQFQRYFFPQEDFLQQPQKQSMQRVKQAILRQSPLLLLLTYALKMAIAALTILNCMLLFTEASSKLSSYFFIILWMNLIQDYIQIFALVCLVAILMVIFVVFIVFTRTANLIKKYKHKQKLKLRLQSLNKTKFIKSDNPEQTKECSICLSEYENEEQVITLNCDSKHVFHQECIETWVKQKDECPLCRAIIFN